MCLSLLIVRLSLRKYSAATTYRPSRQEFVVQRKLAII